MSDYNERKCWNCGSYLHHEDFCLEPDRNEWKRVAAQLINTTKPETSSTDNPQNPNQPHTQAQQQD